MVECLIAILHLIFSFYVVSSPSTIPWLRLPMDPMLSSGPDHPTRDTDPPSLSLLPASTPPPSPSVLVAEGMPPIPAQLLEQIRKWEFIDLAALLGDQDSSSQVLSYSQLGQVLILGTNQATRKTKAIHNIFSWLKAFSMYMAALISVDSTSKEAAAGLAAHLHLIL